MVENNKKFLEKGESTIVLIDGNALVHRAFHAIPPLTTKDGVLVNAVYGFANTIFHILENLQPQYIAVAFDVSRETFRNKIYPQYKATRVKAPDELYAQFPLVKEVCKVLNIPQFGVKGYEADDVIGTIAKKLMANSQKLKALIATGDQDTLQLINQNTAVYNLGRGIRRAEIIDEKRFQEKYGFPAKYMVDFKALRGDPSDNIPGVPGVGEKIAGNLIKIFGSIEKLYSYLDGKIPITKFQFTNKSHPSTAAQDALSLSNGQIPNSKLQKLLLDNKKQAELSKKLAQIACDVPLDFKLVDAKVHDYDKKDAERLFRKLEFKSLLARLPRVEPNHSQNSLF